MQIALETTREEVTRIYEEAKHYVNDEESAMLRTCDPSNRDPQVDQDAS